MTFLQLYTEVANLRFNTSATKVAQIKNWLNAREAEVWAYADWPIKQTSVLNANVVNGVATVALPAGVTIAPQLLQVFDENGSELDYMDPAEFFETFQPYQVPSVSPGPGIAWTITTDPTGPTLQLRIGPTPSANRTYTVRGWALPIKRTAAATWALGLMSADTDLPWWPDEFHYFLVDGAIAYGKRLESDTTWQADESIFQGGLERLADALLPIARRGVEQWGG